MNKPDDKVVDHPGGKPAATVLRLVPRPERDEQRGTATARRDGPGRAARPPAWDGDDDDPGPAAA